MLIEHVAIWTKNLEDLKTFYKTYFNASAGEKYRNEIKQFESYFLTFDSGARLELMQRPSVPVNKNDPEKQYLGIIHLAFAMNTKEEVDHKAKELKTAGYSILSGPRTTGDGYYEFETLDPDNNRIEVTSLT